MTDIIEQAEEALDFNEDGVHQNVPRSIVLALVHELKACRATSAETATAYYRAAGELAELRLQRACESGDCQHKTKNPMICKPE